MKIKTPEQLFYRLKVWLRYCDIKKIEHVTGLPSPEMLGIYNCKKTGLLTIQDLLNCL